LEEFESRVVPALYYVNLSSPFEGVPGSTAATHSGGLVVNPDLPVANGQAVVGASSPADAVRAALQGTVTVSIVGQPVGYTFGRDTAGLSVAAHQPFLVEMTGTSGKAWLEDLAGLPELGVDWDYNDRSWGVTVQALEANGKGSHNGPPGGGGVGLMSLIDEDSWTWTDSMGQTASVSYEVTADEYGEWTWRYTVTNNDLSVMSKSNYGISSIDIAAEVGAEIYDVEVESGVTGWAADPDYPYWSRTEGGSFIAPGGEAVFKFKSLPLPILDVMGMALVAAHMPMAADGPAKGPGKFEIVITDRTSTAIPTTGTLKVAKWHDTFQLDAAGTGVEIKGPTAGTNHDFIDRDDDRFNVWVYDKAAWAVKNHTTVKLSTTNVAGFTTYNDAATSVSLVKYTGGIEGKGDDGWFWSDSQMLMSNELDDVEEWAGYLAPDESSPGGDALPKNGFTWKISDRTHRIALRGTVKAEYEVAPNQHRSIERVAKVTKNVKVHITILKNGGIEVIGSEAATLAVHKANEQTAQVGILLIPSTPQIVNSPVNLNDGFEAVTNITNGILDMTTEEQALLGDATLRTAATDDVELYFVNHFGNRPTLRGQSYWFAGVPENKYVDSVIISVEQYKAFTISHEIGHLLLNSGGHYTGALWPANLMRSGTSAADSADASKRLTSDQQTALLANRQNLLTGP
jgi:hypothetical protein